MQKVKPKDQKNLAKLVREWLATDTGQGARHCNYLAKGTGIHATAISKFLKGERVLSEQSCVRLAVFLRYSVIDVFELGGYLSEVEAEMQRRIVLGRD